MTRILFIHNTALWYRIPFFQTISQIYRIKFIFTHMQVSETLYGEDDPEKGMEKLDYMVLAQHLGLAWGLINEALKKYDVMVGGSWDTVPEALETIIYFTIAKLKRKPFILWREDWDWSNGNTSKGLLKMFIKFIVKYSAAVLVPGTLHQKYYLSLGASPEKIFLMPNVSNIPLPENLEQYAQELKKILGIGNKNVILYLGRLIPRKGVHYLIRALKYIDIKEYVLLIVGDGECRDELKKQVEELGMGEYVIFTGKIPHEKLAIYYQISDVVVLPSITHGIGDPWVMVLNEAMFLKKPVIATNAVGAAPDMIINGKNGYIIPERDVESLSKSLNMILKNQDLAMEMGLESYKIVTGHFQYVNMADGFKNAVEYSLKKG